MHDQRQTPQLGVDQAGWWGGRGGSEEDCVEVSEGCRRGHCRHELFVPARQCGQPVSAGRAAVFRQRPADGRRVCAAGVSRGGQRRGSWVHRGRWGPWGPWGPWGLRHRCGAGERGRDRGTERDLASGRGRQPAGVCTGRGGPAGAHWEREVRGRWGGRWAAGGVPQGERGHAAGGAGGGRGGSQRGVVVDQHCARVAGGGDAGGGGDGPQAGGGVGERGAGPGDARDERGRPGAGGGAVRGACGRGGVRRRGAGGRAGGEGGADRGQSVQRGGSARNPQGLFAGLARAPVGSIKGPVSALFLSWHALFFLPSPTQIHNTASTASQGG